MNQHLLVECLVLMVEGVEGVAEGAEGDREVYLLTREG